MLSIRYHRVGKKKQAFFKIVVNDKRKSAQAGSSLEELGYYNPKTKERSLKVEKIQYWLKNGAKPSGTVYNLLVEEGVITGTKKPVHKKKKAEVAK